MTFQGRLDLFGKMRTVSLRGGLMAIHTHIDLLGATPIAPTTSTMYMVSKQHWIIKKDIGHSNFQSLDTLYKVSCDTNECSSLTHRSTLSRRNQSIEKLLPS
jgi:hypothetical protein